MLPGAIDVRGLGKAFKLYGSRTDKLVEWLTGGLEQRHRRLQEQVRPVLAALSLSRASAADSTASAAASTADGRSGGV